MFSLFGWYDGVLCRFASKFLWKLQRNEPGWFVGEHKHVFFFDDVNGVRLRLTAEKDLLGEVWRLSIENLTEDDVVCGDDPYTLIRVGEDDRWKREDDDDEVDDDVNGDVDDVNGDDDDVKGDDDVKEDDDEIDEAQNLPEGECERCWWRDVVAAIVVSEERESVFQWFFRLKKEEEERKEKNFLFSFF